MNLWNAEWLWILTCILKLVYSSRAFLAHIGHKYVFPSKYLKNKITLSPTVLSNLISKLKSIRLQLYVCVLSCVWLCSPGDWSPPGSSVLGISQARILDWVAIYCSRGSSWPRGWTRISCGSSIAGFFTMTQGNPPHRVDHWLNNLESLEWLFCSEV